MHDQKTFANQEFENHTQDNRISKMQRHHQPTKDCSKKNFHSVHSFPLCQPRKIEHFEWMVVKKTLINTFQLLFQEVIKLVAHMVILITN